MRFLRSAVGVTLSFVLVATDASAADPPPQISVDQIVCRYTSDCKADDPDAVAKFEDTRGFSLSTKEAAERKNVISGGNQKRARPAVKRARSARLPGVSRNDLLVSFQNNSIDLTDQARANITVLAQALNSPKLAGRHFEIEGHTNRIGSQDHNLDLSKRRAEAVAEYLVQNGVSRSRLRVKGFGFAQLLPGLAPRAPQHRRVEADMIKGN